MEPNSEGVYPCCEDLSNRTYPDKDPERGDVVISVCEVCARRHYEVDLDAGHYDIFGRG